MRANQLRQVLSTYTAKWVSWVLVLLWLFTQVPLLGGTRSPTVPF
jgi:hypothetical protein